MTTEQIRNLFLRHTNLRLRRKSKKSKSPVWSVWRNSLPRTYKFSLKVYSAVTGEVFKARAQEETKRKLQNIMKSGGRVILDTLFIPKRSSTYNFSLDEWRNYPILLELGSCKMPYIIYAIQYQRVDDTSKCIAFLHSIDNIEYFQAISLKKDLLLAKRGDKLEVVNKKKAIRKPKGK